MGTQPTGHPRARHDVMFRQVDDEWVVFDPAANELHVLNLSAALVWTHLTGEATLEEIARTVQDTFEIESERAEADVGAAVQRFRDAGLLVGDD